MRKLRPWVESPGVPVCDYNGLDIQVFWISGMFSNNVFEATVPAPPPSHSFVLFVELVISLFIGY